MFDLLPVRFDAGSGREGAAGLNTKHSYVLDVMVFKAVRLSIPFILNYEGLMPKDR